MIFFSYTTPPFPRLSVEGTRLEEEHRRQERVQLGVALGLSSSLAFLARHLFTHYLLVPHLYNPSLSTSRPSISTYSISAEPDKATYC